MLYKPIKPSKQLFEYPQYSYNTKSAKKPNQSQSSNLALKLKPHKFKLRHNQRLLSLKTRNLNLPMTSKQASIFKIDESSDPQSNDIEPPQTTIIAKPHQEEEVLPTLFDDLISKKTFEPSILKDKGFFTHYMICKYIDDLPNSWSSEEAGTLLATADLSVTNQETSFPDLKMDNSKRGLKRTLENDSDSITSDQNRSTSSSSNKESLHDAQHFKNTQNSKLIQTHTKSCSSSAQNFLENKIDFLLTKNDSFLPLESATKADPITFKKTNSNSSKSHSKIVLIDENDNDEEEDLLNTKMIISQSNEEVLLLNETKSNPQIKETLTPSPQAPRYARLSKDALSKHTRDQDDMYILDILKKVQRQHPKKVSERPQNVCAQAPNVFSRNEYEPPNKKNKIFEESRQLKERNQNEHKRDTMSASSAELVAQYETELSMGPYGSSVNNVDCDNPQQFHGVFSKKLQTDLAIGKERPAQRRMKAESKKVDEKSQSTKQSVKDKDSFSSSCSDPAGSSSNRNDDVIRFWKKCIRHGSAIVKCLKESDNLIKLIGSRNGKRNEIEVHLQNQENELHANQSSTGNVNSFVDPVLDSSEENAFVLRYTKELKKRLFTIANLLGLSTDIGFDDISVDSNKSQAVESCIKKIFQELLNSTSSLNLHQYTSTLSSLSPNKIDTNSIDLLTAIYEDLKQKFLDQFDRFNKENRLIFNSSSSPAVRSSSYNNDSESSSTNQNQQHQQDHHLQNPNKSSPARSRSNFNKSTHDFEFSSHNTNEFDDSSTYLYDSTTSSLESSDLQSNSNRKSSLNQHKNQLKIKHDKTNSITDDNSRPKTTSFSESSSSGDSSASSKPNEKQKVTTAGKAEETSFDDGLICKIMQNYVDLFKNKSMDPSDQFMETDTSIDQFNHFLADIPTTSYSSFNTIPVGEKSFKTSTIGSVQVVNESSHLDGCSDESKSNRKLAVNVNREKSCNENRVEEECIKDLSLYIYNDCFKCLSNVSTVSEQKSKNINSNNYETESESV